MDACPRMRDTLRPEDLNTDACVNLASTILSETAEDYLQTRRHLTEDPTNEHVLAHMGVLKAFYKSELFVALSMGATDGETAMRELDKMAAGKRVTI